MMQKYSESCKRNNPLKTKCAQDDKFCDKVCREIVKLVLVPFKDRAKRRNTHSMQAEK